ncbi:MAG TPA: hypothetical protein VHW66_21885 [Stellaceae bacterium]|nr:hypothetical protein [Stellaceae bacterium]
MNVTPGSRLIGDDWQAHPDLVAVADHFAGAFVPADCANITRALCRRLDPVSQYIMAAEILASPEVARATAARVEWRPVPASAIDGFAAAVPPIVMPFLLFGVARRLPAPMQRALALEVVRPLGMALTGAPSRSVH